VTALQDITFEMLGPARCQVGESPLWSPAEQALGWVDIADRALHRHHPGSGRCARWGVPQRLACARRHALQRWPRL
jgi:sugar lactone lactonase YvrE